jgi:hypothetical protein
VGIAHRDGEQNHREHKRDLRLKQSAIYNQQSEIPSLCVLSGEYLPLFVEPLGFAPQ